MTFGPKLVEGMLRSGKPVPLNRCENHALALSGAEFASPPQLVRSSASLGFRFVPPMCGGTMKLLACAALIGVLVPPCVAADGVPELSAWDLLAEYERLVPVNQALHQGKGFPPAEKLPKHLGTFQSRE